MATAIIIYASDADDCYPYAHSTAEAQQQVFPYYKDAKLWSSKNPEGGRLLYNTSISGLTSTAIESPSQTPLLWDEKPWPDGGRNVAFADAHAKYVSREEWDGLIWPFELRRRSLRTKRPSSALPSHPH